MKPGRPRTVVPSTARGLTTTNRKVLFIMATQDSSNTPRASQLMTPEEMRGLARRLTARADSVLMRDQPHQANDLRQSASLIERLAHVLAEIRRAADATEDESTERHLRELVGGA
jgi:hypothetical protein